MSDFPVDDGVQRVSGDGAGVHVIPFLSIIFARREHDGPADSNRAGTKI
jgi:hypothetical protein